MRILPEADETVVVVFAEALLVAVVGWISSYLAYFYEGQPFVVVAVVVAITAAAAVVVAAAVAVEAFEVVC